MKRILIICMALICVVPTLHAQTTKKKTKKVVKKTTKPKTIVKKTTATIPTAADSVKIYDAMVAKKAQEAEVAKKQQDSSKSAAAKMIEMAKAKADSMARDVIGGIIPSSTTPPSTIQLPTGGNTSTPTSSQTNNSSSGTASNSDIISGLKEALKIGTDNSSKKLNKVDGFFADAAIKILMPAEAQKVEKTLRSIGMGGLVDKAVLSMNRAAEDAAGGIGDIFWTAIKQMNITDGIQILRGGDFAATNYLKNTTTSVLTEKFRPVIESSLGKTGATKYWKDAFSAYNSFSSTPVNTDLTAYVTEKALAGLFYNIGLEEQKIRKDPVAQVTSLLKKVFGGN